MNVETNSEKEVIKDGKVVGNIVEGAFVPIDGLHPKTIKAVETRLESICDTNEAQSAKPKKDEKHDPEPARTAFQGVNTPEYVEWAKRNFSAERLEELYGKNFHRLEVTERE